MVDFIKRNFYRYRHHWPVVFFWGAGLISSILSGVASILTVKLLSLEEFANISFYLSIQSIILIVLNPLTGTTIRFAGELHYAKHPKRLWRYIFRLGLWNVIGGGVLTIGAILTARWWTDFFQFPRDVMSISIVLSFFLIFFIFSWVQALLTAFQQYIYLGVQNILLSLIKLIFLGIAVLVTWKFLTVLVSYPVSILISGLFLFYPTFLLIRPHFQGFGKSFLRIPRSMQWFFLNSLFLNLGNIVLLNLDIMLVKHYLPPAEAGIYATLNVLGKMLLLINGSFIGILTPLLVARLNKPALMRKVLVIIVGLTVVVSGASILILAILPPMAMRFLFKEKADMITPYLLPYLVAVANLCILFGISTYQLVKKRYAYSWVVISCATLEGVLIYLYHEHVTDIVHALLLASLIAVGVIGVAQVPKLWRKIGLLSTSG